mmetsp:Transcript_18574/g.45583  ORF Transcript_18574/g.45583 Transcript_18574/m.45583 type:complete len:84 (+) Transcript_18574:60-311(+)
MSPPRSSLNHCCYFSLFLSFPLHNLSLTAEAAWASEGGKSLSAGEDPSLFIATKASSSLSSSEEIPFQHIGRTVESIIFLKAR